MSNRIDLKLKEKILKSIEEDGIPVHQASKEY